MGHSLWTVENGSLGCGDIDFVTFEIAETELWLVSDSGIWAFVTVKTANYLGGIDYTPMFSGRRCLRPGSRSEPRVIFSSGLRHDGVASFLLEIP